METLTGAVIGLVMSAVLAILAMLGRRYEGRESRAVTTQATVIDDLENSNARLRGERDEAIAALAREAKARQRADDLLREYQDRAGVPRRRRTDDPHSEGGYTRS